MPEIFDQNHDWVGDLLSKEPEECDLFTFYAVPSIGLLLHLSKGALVHCSIKLSYETYRFLVIKQLAYLVFESNIMAT